MHRQELRLSEMVLGKEHLSTLTSMNNLATMLSHARTNQAEEVRSTQAEGCYSPTRMNNLVGVLSFTDKYEDGEEMHRHPFGPSEAPLSAR